MDLFTALSTALTGKAAATLAGLTLAGGGLAVAIDAAQPADEATPVIAERESDDDESVERPEDLELVVEENDTAENGTHDQGRAADVHEALTDGEAEPGDDDFGQIVSENAREDGRDFGQNVAEAARDGAGEEQASGGQARADEDQGDAEAGHERAEAARTQAPEATGTDTSDDEDADASEQGADNADRAQGAGGR
jgi:hypothetical protein